MPTIDIIEPFRQGVMVQFAHKLGNAFADTMDVARVIGSKDFELSSLARNYEFIEGFDIPRDDKVGGTGRRNLTARVGREVSKIRVLWQFLDQYSKAIDGVVKRQSDYTLMATIFRYPRMTSYLKRLRRAGVRPLQICHEYEMREERKTIQARLTHRLNRRAYEHFHAIFFLSESQKSGFAKTFPFVDRSRLFVIPCGNAEIFKEIRTPESPESVALRYGMKRNIETVLFFGRIRPDKGVEDLIEAFDLVRRRLGRPVQLMLAGHATPSFHDRLTERINRLGLAEQTIVYPDYIDSADVWAIHQTANVAVFPYRSSSQSAAVQTAMACELPIVVTDVGGLAETIEHERSGLVVPTSPAEALVERLADSIIRMLNEPDAAKRMGANAGNLSRTVFAWETIAERMTVAAMSVAPLSTQRSAQQ